MKNPKIADDVWAGTEPSLQIYLDALSGIQTKVLAGARPDEEENDLPYLLNIVDGVGVVSISGSLTHRESPWNALFGVTSYGAIREAVVAAATNEQVKHILLDIDSPGGSANGVSDVADLIRTVHDKVKPVTAFAGGTMASAAYWIGCAAGKVYATKMSNVGSIGVIATHMEYSKQLKEDGVGVTVLRAGKYKALMNSVEPLTAEAKQQYQEKLDTAYQIFVQYVADMRGHAYAYVDEKMAQGMEFMGEAAYAVGLVDGVNTYDEVVSKIQESFIDKPASFNHNPRNLTQGVDNMHKKALSAQEIAALAEGGLVPQAAASEAAPAVPSAEAAAAAAAAAAAPAPEAAAAAPAPEAAAAPAAAAAAAPETASQPAVQPGELVVFLQSQLAGKDQALIQAGVEARELQNQVDKLQAMVQPMAEIVAKSVNHMRVALGGSAVSFEASKMDIPALLDEYRRTSADFSTKFQAGGVAAVDAAEASKGEKQVVDHLHHARLAAV